MTTTTKRRALGRGLAALIPAAAGPSATGAVAGTGTGAAAQPAGARGDGAMGPFDATAPRPAGASTAASGPTARASGDGREGLRTVAIEDVHPARSQPRKTFDDARLDELAASIRSQGLIQPLVARVREAGGYEIIAGERRWRAAQRAGLHSVPVVVREIAPARAFELAMVENLQREDLNPIEEAEGFDRLIREFGYSQESLAARVGKDRSTVANALRLLKLPPGVRSLVISGRLSMGHARAILGLEGLTDPRHAAAPSVGSPPPAVSAADVAEHMERVGRKVAAREMSVRQVEALVRSEKDGRATAGPRPAPQATSTVSGRDLATRLSRALGTPVRVVETAPGRGHLQIPYASLDQLDGFLAKLMS